MNSLGGDDDFDNLPTSSNVSNAYSYSQSARPKHEATVSSSYQASRNVEEDSSSLAPTVVMSKYNEKQLKELNDNNISIFEKLLDSQIPEVAPLESDFVIQNNINTLNNVTQAHIYSSDLSDTYGTFYCPLYCNRITHSKLYIDAFLTSDKALMITIPPECLKSCTDYAQGNPPIEFGTPKGDLKNTFLLSVTISNVSSNADYPIAINIGSLVEKPGSNQKTFGEFSKQQVKCIRSDKLKTVTLAHEIIPPRANSLRLQLYASDYEINNPFAMDYPWLTSDEKVISTDKDIKKVDDNCYVPLHHPVAKWIYLNAALYGWQVPEKTSSIEKDPNTYFLFSRSQHDKAVSEISKLMKRLEIRDLSNFTLQLKPLSEVEKNGERSKSQYVSFALQIKHVFRERYDAS